MQNHDWHSIEKDAGLPDGETVDMRHVDEKRRVTYQSYESFLRARLKELDNSRSKLWKRDYRNKDAYEKSISLMRERLKELFGFWVEPSMRPSLRCENDEVLLKNNEFTVRRFSLEVLPGLTSYALEMSPNTTGAHPGLLLQHGYGGTPELICGLTENANREDYSYRSLGLRAVNRGYHVVAVHHPYGYGSLKDEWFGLTEFPKMPGEYARNRLDRLARLSGAALFGIDLMASSRGIDLLLRSKKVDSDRIGMYGLSQGGQTALFLPAIDTRIRASVVSAYFNERITKLIGSCDGLCYLDSNEEDKFFSEVVSVFSDADVASLIAPRAFAVEAGRLDLSVDFEKAKSEFELAKKHYEKLGISSCCEFIAHELGHVSATKRAFDFLGEHLGTQPMGVG